MIPSNVWALMHAPQLLVCMVPEQAALISATAATRLVPTMGRAYYEIAACHELAGDEELAMNFLSIAKRCALAPCLHGAKACLPLGEH